MGHSLLSTATRCGYMQGLSQGGRMHRMEAGYEEFRGETLCRKCLQ